MLVWDMNKEQFIKFEKWMIWCPYIWTKGLGN
jgi:hypothetical protein